MRGHPPEMPKRIFELAGAVAVKLIRDGLSFFGASRQRPLEEGIYIGHIHVETYRRPSQRFWRLPTVFWEFVRKHDHGIAQANFGMAKASVGHYQFVDLGGAERLLVKLK